MGGYSLERIAAEIEKCDVLCKPHHKEADAWIRMSGSLHAEE